MISVRRREQDLISLFLIDSWKILLIGGNLKALKHIIIDDLPAPLLTVEPFPPKIKVTAICFLRDGKVAIGSDKGAIVIWDLSANKKLSQVKSKAQVNALAQLKDGSVVSGTDEGDINVYKHESMELLQTINCATQAVLWLKVLPNGHLAACCAKIYVWDLTSMTGQAKRRRTEPEAEFEPDLIDIYCDYQEWQNRAPEGSYLTKSCVLNIEDWDVEPDEDPEMTLEYNFELLSNGHLALCYLRPEVAEVIIWNPESGREVKKMQFEGDSCTLLPTGDAVVCRDDDQVELYSLQDQTMFHSFTNNKGQILAINQQSKHWLQFVHLKDLRRIKDLCSQICSTGFSDDGKYLAVGGNNSKLFIWSLKP